MKTKSKDIIKQDKIFIYLALVTGLILLIPLIAMQFTYKVNWNLFDFIVAGTLLFGTGFLFVLIARRTNKYRVIIGLILTAVLILIWAELAVGIFGTPFAGD